MGQRLMTSYQTDFSTNYTKSSSPLPEANSLYRIISKTHEFKTFISRSLDLKSRSSSIEKVIELFKQLSHPNIIQFIGYDFHPTEKGYNYSIIVEEASCNLDSFLITHPNHFDALDNVYFFMSQLLNAVCYLQIHNTSHGNIKPSNILLTDKYVFKLDLEVPYPDNKPISRTYSAPELLNYSTTTSSAVNYQKADNYSLGLIFLRVCGIDLDAYAINTFTEAATYQTTLQQLLSKLENKYQTSDLSNFVLHLLSFDPYERPLLSDLKLQYTQRFKTPENPLFQTDFDMFHFHFRSLSTPTLSKNRESFKQVQKIHLIDNAPITKVLVIDQDKIVTSSRSIMVWDLYKSKTKPIREFGPTEGHVINIIKLSNTRIVSSFGTVKGPHLTKHRGSTIISGLSEIKIWNIDNGLCEKTLRGHRASVLPLIELPFKILMSGSLDCTIRFWDLNKTEDECCFRVIQNKVQGPCRSIVLLDKELLAVTSQAAVNVYKIAEGSLPLRSFGHNEDQNVSELVLLNDFENLLAWTTNVKGAKIRIWTWRTGVLLKSIEHVSLSIPGSLRVYSYELIATGVLGGVIFWDWNEEKRSKTYTITAEFEDPWMVNALAFYEDGRFISAGTMYNWKTVEKELVGSDDGVQGDQYIVFWK